MYDECRHISTANPCGTIFHCMQGTTHRSSSLNDTATSSEDSLQEAQTQKVEVTRAFWIHTSRSHDHSTPRSFLLVATTTSMRQSLSSNASITLSVSQLQLSITPFPCFSFLSFLLSHLHPSTHNCRLPTQSNDIRKAFSSLPARNGIITDHRQVL